MNDLVKKRCWIGKEVEHNDNYGKKVLFVEAATVDFLLVYELLQKIDCEVVYLGAGELDVINVLNLEYIDKVLELVPISLECSSDSLSSIPKKLLDICSTLIIRQYFDIDVVKNSTKSVFMKYRTSNDVYLSEINSNSNTSLSNLVDMKYSDDIIIYEEGVFK